MKKGRNKLKGITLIELLIASSLFSIIVGMAAETFVYITKTQGQINIEQEFYEETRFAMEKIVKEIRQGTVDYEEYYSNIRERNGSDDFIYGDDYEYSSADHERHYADQFYDCREDTDNPPDGDPCYDEDDSNTGVYNEAPYFSALDGYEQDELYIINLGGNKKTILRLGSFNDGAFTGTGIYMLKLEGHSPTDKRVFSEWLCAKNFNCKGSIAGDEKPDTANASLDGFSLITPRNISVKSLKFYIAPLDDPWKAFNEIGPDIQMQPRITVMMAAELGGKKKIAYKKKFIPSISLETTVSARSFAGIKSIKR